MPPRLSASGYREPSIGYDQLDTMRNHQTGDDSAISSAQVMSLIAGKTVQLDHIRGSKILSLVRTRAICWWTHSTGSGIMNMTLRGYFDTYRSHNGLSTIDLTATWLTQVDACRESTQPEPMSPIACSCDYQWGTVTQVSTGSQARHLHVQGSECTFQSAHLLGKAFNLTTKNSKLLNLTPYISIAGF
ncbi:hypothetical protein DOTSEDRAFT_35605 [Dothistroma septosporum NZE10]|uniref:Uncharacterized protein n=1 Tax=Dothistroma septosporum (strain NZE10 / CBS 128990) TaxID=675120 RepID=M2XLK3_DOTSN|nr:hypothetical protein DOTSEDRAFT_35605 [Dothistroma septosporum NZE10]